MRLSFLATHFLWQGHFGPVLPGLQGAKCSISAMCGPCRPLEKRERNLHHTGPNWSAPTITEVLGNLPFLRQAPRNMLEVGWDRP